MPRVPEVIASYIAAQPEEVRPVLQEIHSIIAGAYPKAKAEMYGTAKGAMPVYKDGETWLGGFSLRSKGPMVYLIDQEVVARYRPQLGSLADGKSCVLYKTTKTMDSAALKALLTEMFAEAAAKRK